MENTEKLSFSIAYPGKPEAYARERTGRGHFYNPKSGKAKLLKEYVAKNMPKKIRERMKKIIANKDAVYYVSFDLVFLIPIAKSDSKKKRAAKLEGSIRPATRPDIDNYLKFVMDALHDVLYDDDKRVTKISGSKEYGETEVGTTYINVEINIIEE